MLFVLFGAFEGFWYGGLLRPFSAILSSRETERRTSGKSTQKAFIFMPYRKLAKLSLNLLKLSCINCKCMKLASRSAIESDSSAKAGSRNSNGNAEEPDLGVKV